ncbi:hypothetical protein D3C75_681010 [compost metagenome]
MTIPELEKQFGKERTGQILEEEIKNLIETGNSFLEMVFGLLKIELSKGGKDNE